MTNSTQKRFAIWLARTAVESDYEEHEYFRVLKVIENGGSPTELVVGKGYEEPDADSLCVLKKTSPINRSNMLYWRDRLWFWIEMNQ